MNASFKSGDRIRLIRMVDDPDPVPSGTTGTVIADPVLVYGSWQVSVKWDNGRGLSLCVPPDVACVIKE